MKIIALLDCNNFYASCERVFNPSLRNRPIVVLSNNDGCIIARSNEAKKLGIAMGEPVFKAREIIDKHNVYLRSANFTLYSDLSQRVMASLDPEVEELEVYSIDEAFIVLGDTNTKSPEQVYEEAVRIKEKIQRHTGIPVSIGVATSKTLAKLANKIAKQGSGVHSLYFDQRDESLVQASLDAELADFPVEDIWGIGRVYKKFLLKHGIHTALDLKYANHHWVKREMKVNGLRLVLELAGKSCIPMNNYSIESPSHSVICSRSFSKKVSDLSSLEEALANFTSIAAAKLRAKKLCARSLCVFLRELDSSTDWKGRKVTSSIALVRASSSSSELIEVVCLALKKIYKEDCFYKKAGLVLFDLVNESDLQLSLFSSDSKSLESQNRNQEISALVDSINDSFGVNTLFWAAMGTGSGSVDKGWKAEQKSRSPCYTTDWNELPVLRGHLEHNARHLERSERSSG